MKQIRFSLLLAVAVFFSAFSSCNGSAKSGIKGAIKNASNLQVTLDQAHFDRSTVALGKATCDANGNFEINPEKPLEEGLYRLSIGAKRLYFILNGKESTIQIEGDLGTIDRLEMTINGSETFTCYADIIRDLIKNQLKSPEDARAAIKKGCTPLMQAFLTTQLLGQNAGGFIDDFKAQSKALDESMPGSKYSSDFKNMIAQLEKQIAQQQAGPEASAGPVQVGMTAPDISLPGPDGKVHTLSAMRGKVVLLDFWASWCGPCRRSNPHVVEMYNKYKGKGFDVFSVSLDRPDGRDKWVEAIKQDGLSWNNHVSDLKYWDSEPAALYGVHSIPKTFLIGKDGKVIAVDPRNNLEQELMKVL